MIETLTNDKVEISKVLAEKQQALYLKAIEKIERDDTFEHDYGVEIDEDDGLYYFSYEWNPYVSNMELNAKSVSYCPTLYKEQTFEKQLLRLESNIEVLNDETDPDTIERLQRESDEVFLEWNAEYESACW